MLLLSASLFFSFLQETKQTVDANRPIIANIDSAIDDRLEILSFIRMILEGLPM